MPIHKEFCGMQPHDPLVIQYIQTSVELIKTQSLLVHIVCLLNRVTQVTGFRMMSSHQVIHGQKFASDFLQACFISLWAASDPGSEGTSSNSPNNPQYSSITSIMFLENMGFCQMEKKFSTLKNHPDWQNMFSSRGFVMRSCFINDHEWVFIVQDDLYAIFGGPGHNWQALCGKCCTFNNRQGIQHLSIWLVKNNNKGHPNRDDNILWSLQHCQNDLSSKFKLLVQCTTIYVLLCASMFKYLLVIFVMVLEAAQSCQKWAFLSNLFGIHGCTLIFPCRYVHDTMMSNLMSAWAVVTLLCVLFS
jgi:hypothetical protein